MYRSSILCLSALMAATTMLSAAAEDYAPRVGKPHPEVLLPSIADGKPVSLLQYRGRKVLLIHFASW